MELSDIYNVQKDQNRHWVNYLTVDDKEKLELVQEYILSMNLNGLKILDEMNWQRHILNKKELDINNVKEHCVDMLKYLLSILLIFDINIDDFTNSFNNKTKVVDEKWRQEQIIISQYQKIITIDIDEIIFSYLDSFYNYMCDEIKWLKNYEVFKRTSYHFYNYICGITTEIEEEMNKSFIENGMFRNLSIVDGSVKYINRLKKEGYVIILLTARDYKRYERLYYDTYFNLQSVGCNYDKIIWNKSKSDSVTTLMPAKVLYHIEDRDKHALEVASVGINVLLLNKDYNGKIDHSKISIVNNWEEIYAKITK